MSEDLLSATKPLFLQGRDLGSAFTTRLRFRIVSFLTGDDAYWLETSIPSAADTSFGTITAPLLFPFFDIGDNEGERITLFSDAPATASASNEGNISTKSLPWSK